jgi:hypothetical protein
MLTISKLITSFLRSVLLQNYEHMPYSKLILETSRVSDGTPSVYNPQSWDVNTTSFMSKFKGIFSSHFDMEKQTDWLVQLMEKVVFLLYCILTAPDLATRLKFVGLFLVTSHKGSVAKKAEKFLRNLITELSVSNQSSADGYVTQSGELRSLLDNWDRANESPLALKIRALASYCMAFSLIEKCGFSENFAEIMYAEFRVQKQTKKVTSFIYAILDVMEFVLSRARTCYETGSMKPMFHSSSTYLDWYDLVDKVRLNFKLRGGVGEYAINDANLLLDLEKCIQQGTDMASFAKTAVEKKSMQSIVTELKLLQNDINIEKGVAKTRETPFAALIFGNSSIGKSSLTELMGKRYAQVCGLDYNQDCRYDRSAFDQYMSGFRSSKWFIVMDDVACLSPDKCSNGDLSLVDVIQLINCAPYTSNQAELEKKGKVPVLAKLVIANSNVKDLNVFHYFSHPSAVQRRFNFVVIPSVKEEFRTMSKEGLIDALDGNKAINWQKDHVGAVPDFWDFDIIEWLPSPVGSLKTLAIEYKPFGERKIGMKEFLKYYDGRITKHLRSQKSMTASVEKMREARACGVCGEFYQFCESREEHSAEDDVACSKCNRVDCIYKHVCDLRLQADEMPSCSGCEHEDCLWSTFQDASVGKCETCDRCISGEDVMEGSCTYCMVQNVYHAQSNDGARGFMLFALALLLQFMTLHRAGYSALAISAIQRRKLQIEQGIDLSTTALGVIDTTHAFGESVYSHYLRKKQIVSDLGQNAARILSNRPVMLILGIVLAGIVSMKKMSSLFTSDIFTTQSEPTKTVVTENEPVNVWARTNYVLSPHDVAKGVQNFRALTQEKFDKMILRNIVVLDMYHEGGIRRTRAFCFADRYYLINKHSVPMGDFTMDLCQQPRVDGCSENVRGIYVSHTQISHLRGDVSVLFIPQISQKKNLVELFPTETYRANTHGMYYSRETDGTPSTMTVKNINYRQVDHPSIENGSSFVGFEAKTAAPTVVGYCGSPMIGDSHQGRVILGIHTLGNKQGSAIASRVLVEDLRSFLKDKMPIDDGETILSCKEREFELQGLHPKSTFMYAEEGTATVFGSLKGHRSSGKSRVGDTCVSKDLIENEGFVRTHGAPIMSGYKPWRIAMLPMIESNFPLPYDKVERAVDGFFNDASQSLPRGELGLLQVITQDDAINGINAVYGMDKMDFSTSAGMPRCKGKKFFLEEDPNFEVRRYRPTQDLQREIDTCLANYKAGRRNNFVFMGSLKDEAREFEKIAMGKIRVFTGQPFALGIIGRQYYLSFVRLMQRNRLHFECAIGTNAHSQDWDDIAHHLIDFSEFIFDGDYKNYDKSMMAMVIMCIFDGIIRFHKRHCTHMDHEDFLVMRGIGYDVAYAYVNFNGDLVSFLRNNPSGHLLTVIINSICGGVYLRIGFEDATGIPLEEFRMWVRSVTYGDDVLVSVQAKIVKQFNFATYQQALAAYNITFTPANKTGEVYTTRRLEDVDFLKRSFVFNTELNRFTGPLAKSSISKSLITCVQSTTITLEKQTVQIFASAHREMWQHGREAFDQFCEVRNRTFTRNNLHEYVGRGDFPDYEQLLKYYKNRSQDSAWGESTTYIYSHYELQGLDVRSRLDDKTKDITTDSYCSVSFCEPKRENGSVLKSYMSVPRNPFSRKRKLDLNFTKPCSLMTYNLQVQIQVTQTNDYNTSQLRTQEKPSPSEHVTVEILTTDVLEENTQQNDWKDVKHMSPYDESIAQFLSRPVELTSSSFTVGSSFNTIFEGFAQWKNVKSVAAKLANYSFMRGTMHIRFQFDASPFIYGAYLVSISPGEDISSLLLTNANYISYFSQKQAALVDLAMDSDVELSAPLLPASEWQALNSNQSPFTYAVMELAPAASSNGVNTSAIGFRIFAWMTDVELRGATIYTAQSEDVEVHAKHDFAHAKRKVEHVGLVSPHLDVGSHLPTLPSMLAYMQCNPIVDRFNWTNVNPINSVLTSYNVCPNITLTGASANVVCPTPMSFLSKYFSYWRGDLKFTFKVIKSPFHAGTVRMAWDPSYNATATNANLNTNKTVLWNIRETDEMSFIVPHDNYLSWFGTDNGVEYGASNRFSAAFPTLYTSQSTTMLNGSLVVSVYTPLTSPVTTSSVTFLVYLEPCENFEFARMCGGPEDQSSYVAQCEIIGSDMYMGEKFTNLQDLIARPVPSLVVGANNGLVNIPLRTTAGFLASSGSSTFYTSMFPLEYGFDPNGVSNLNKAVSGTAKGNAVHANLISRLITQFVGVRGSVRWTVLCPATLGNVSVGLPYNENPVSPEAQKNGLPLGTGFPITPVSGLMNGFLKNMMDTSNGRAVFNANVNSIMEVQIPYYSNQRFTTTDNTSKYPLFAVGVEEMGLYTSPLYLYCAAGDDFDLIRFKGILPQYITPKTSLDNF